MNNEREELLKKLESIKKNEYKLDDKNEVKKITSLMLKHIGDPDPYLRDKLIYYTFLNWISKECYFSNEELKEILLVVLDDEHLFYKIGNEGNDSVVTRTFSILVVDILLCQNMYNEYLTLDEFNNLKDKVLKYYNEEKDLRGYEKRIGWMHAAAHGADALCSIVSSKQCDEETMSEVLDALNHVLENTTYLLSNEEDERMASVVYAVLLRKVLSREKLYDWIKNLGSTVTQGYSDPEYIKRCNNRIFLRSLYFRFMHEEGSSELTELLYEREAAINNFMRDSKAIKEQIEK